MAADDVISATAAASDGGAVQREGEQHGQLINGFCRVQ